MTEIWAIHHLAILEVVAICITTGLVGALALLHQRIFFAEAVSHAAFPGAVVGVVIAHAWLPERMTSLLFAGAFVGCVLLAGLMSLLARIPGISSQAAAGIVLSCGFAAGYFLATWFKPLPVRVDSFLTGSVLTADATDVVFACVVAGCAGLLWWALGPTIVAVSFDRTLVPRTRTLLVDALVLLLICLGIVAAIPAVGTIVSIALIAAPPAIVQPLVSSPRGLFLWSPLVGVGIGIGGLVLSMLLSLSTGGTIALVAGGAYVLSLSIRSLN